jgi:aminopeptidase-like protein
VNRFIKEWPCFIEVHANAHIERNKEKSVINQTNAKSEFAFKDFLDYFWKERQYKAGQKTAIFIICRLRKALNAHDYCKK